VDAATATPTIPPARSCIAPWPGRAPTSADLISIAYSPAHFLAAGVADHSFSWVHATAAKIADPTILRTSEVRFASDSPLEEGVTCELVSGNPDFNVRKKENGRPKAKFDQYLDLV
jgi:hypothetical protein